MLTTAMVAIASRVALATSMPAQENSASAWLQSYIARYAANRGASAAAIPSFSRQTGLACNACHTTFPQLTGFGRLFKLNGYTLTGLQVVQTGARTPTLKIDLIPPVSTMVLSSGTRLKTALPGTQNDDAEFPQELSLFLGEEISPKMGTFIQFTYEPAEGTFGLDNSDLRFASHAKLASKNVLYGLTLNNNPSVQDVWNSTPVWGFPFASSPVAPSPAAAPVITGTLAQQVAGLGAYTLWNNLVYGELSVYRSAPQGGSHPPDSTATNIVQGVAPYWRVALQRVWGAQYVEVGTYGLYAKLYPTGVTGPTNRFTDIALDAQYERPVGAGNFAAHATWIHERQALDAAFAAGSSTNPSNTLNTVKADASLYTAARVGGAVSYFSTTGNADALLYAAAPVTGSSTGRPSSNGVIAELDAMPWLNTRFAVQYVVYGKFNGATSGYDGFGRNASDNDTLYLLAWLVF